MQSLSQLYRIGAGPSSSHTMAPLAACQEISARFGPEAHYKVTLYGSLAKTGKGHGTDTVIERLWPGRVEVAFDFDTPTEHPNTFHVEVSDGDTQRDFWVESIGGGAFSIQGEPTITPPDIYPERSFTQIKEFCIRRGVRLPDYVRHYEPRIFPYLEEVWLRMKEAVCRGLVADGELPGGLHVARKARVLYTHLSPHEQSEIRFNRLVCSYAYAVAEENAAGGTVVTAPTCGACGVLPAVLYYMQTTYGYTDEQIIDAIAAAGVVGNVIKTNASISGAECGCQAEIGSACSMAAAAVSELHSLSLEQIESAAEIAMEHHLGLTCDPLMGIVQIPCIERNAVAAIRAINAMSLATFLSFASKIGFDAVVRTMYETGRDLSREYRETAEGGLANIIIQSPH